METTVITPTITETLAKRIHEVLHSPAKYPTLSTTSVGGEETQIKKASNGCRYMDIGAIRFMEQNKFKSSMYAKMANNGWKVTWGIKQSGNWLYIAQDPNGIYREIKLT